MLPRDLAARLPSMHEAQERQEAENVAANAEISASIGLEMRDWPDGVWSVRCTRAPGHRPGNQLTGLSAARLVDLERYVAWFDGAGCDMSTRLLGPEIDRREGEKLRACGFAVDEVEAWMAAPMHTLRIEAVEHDIREVRGPEDARGFATAFVEGWRIRSEATRRIALAALTPLPGPEFWRRYVGYVDGEPAAESVLAMFGDVAYLAEAATVPRFRRRGLQRAMIARRVRDAREAGARMVFGGVQYGHQSWANMHALGLREAMVSVVFRRARVGQGM